MPHGDPSVAAGAAGLGAAPLTAAALLLDRVRPGGRASSSERAVEILTHASAEPTASASSVAVGLALYRSNPEAFRGWNREQGAAERARLSPSGVALRGDPVADSALALLTLQAAYRSY